MSNNEVANDVKCRECGSKRFRVLAGWRVSAWFSIDEHGIWQFDEFGDCDMKNIIKGSETYYCVDCDEPLGDEGRG